MELTARSFSELSDICKLKDRIIVSGPQRSGTTFTARQLSNNSKPYVDEFKKPSTKKWVWQFANNSHKTHLVDCDLVVWMLRDESDVSKSEKRINWKYFDIEKKKYQDLFGEIKSELDSNYKMKHYYWNHHQKDQIKCDYVVFRYSDAVDCPEFLDKSLRVSFSAKQTSL